VQQLYQFHCERQKLLIANIPVFSRGAAEISSRVSPVSDRSQEGGLES